MSKRAVLAIHGFSGHPEEMRFLGESVARCLDAQLILPTMAGHAAQPEDLAKTSYRDWYHGIERVFDETARKYDEIVVIGNSFGANLALKLGRQRPVRAIVGIAIPYTRWYQRLLLQLLLLANRPFRAYWTKPSRGPHATEQIPGYLQRCYERIPLRAMAELLKFDAEEANRQKQTPIKLPVLLISPKGDPFVPREAVNIYQQRLGPQVESLPWEDNYHLIVQGTRKNELAETISNWLREKLPDVFDVSHQPR